MHVTLYTKFFLLLFSFLRASIVCWRCADLIFIPNKMHAITLTASIHSRSALAVSAYLLGASTAFVLRIATVCIHNSSPIKFFAFRQRQEFVSRMTWCPLLSLSC